MSERNAYTSTFTSGRIIALHQLQQRRRVVEIDPRSEPALPALTIVRREAHPSASAVAVRSPGERFAECVLDDLGEGTARALGELEQLGEGSAELAREDPRGTVVARGQDLRAVGVERREHQASVASELRE